MSSRPPQQDEMAAITALIQQLQGAAGANGGELTQEDAARAMSMHLQSQSEARQRQREAAMARKAHAKALAESRPPARQWLEEVIPETIFSAGDGMLNAECPVCLQNLRDKAAAAVAAHHEFSVSSSKSNDASSNSGGDGDDGGGGVVGGGGGGGVGVGVGVVPPALLSVRTLHCGHGGCRGQGGSSTSTHSPRSVRCLLLAKLQQEALFPHCVPIEYPVHTSAGHVYVPSDKVAGWRDDTQTS